MTIACKIILQKLPGGINQRLYLPVSLRVESDRYLQIAPQGRGFHSQAASSQSIEIPFGFVNGEPQRLCGSRPKAFLRVSEDYDRGSDH